MKMLLQTNYTVSVNQIPEMGSTEVDFSVIQYLFFLTTFDFYSLYFDTHICTSSHIWLELLIISINRHLPSSI